MGVNVHGRLNIAVPKTFLDDLRLDRGLQEVCCVPVAQSLQGQQIWPPL